MISIIIPTCTGGHKYLLELLPILKREPNSEIIIVDNASNDGTKDLCASHEVIHIENVNNMGFAIACNQGAKKATGDKFLFLNNDVTPNVCFANDMAFVMDTVFKPMIGSSKVGVVGCKIVRKDNPNILQHAGVEFMANGLPVEIGHGQHVDFPISNLERKVHSVTAACMMVRREAFESVGGFYEGYRNGWEDNEFAVSIHEKGWEVVYTPRVVVQHVEHGSAGRMDMESFNVQLYVSRCINTGRVQKIL